MDNTLFEDNSHNYLEILVGALAKASSRGIYKVQLYAANGEFFTPELIAGMENPSCFDISKDKKYLVTISETNEDQVHLYSITNNGLTKLSSKTPLEGAVRVNMGANQKRLAVAKAVYDLEDHAIEQDPLSFEDEGVISQNISSNKRFHYSKFYPNSNFFYALDLVNDRVMVHGLDDFGAIAEGDIALELDKGDGPWHICFHPTKDFCFISNKHSNTVISAKVDPNTGQLTIIDRQKTIPSDFDGYNHAADLQVTPNGRWLFVANCGDNSIVGFRIEADGRLSFVGTEYTRGEWPGNFTVTPQGKYLIVANERSGNVVSLEIDPFLGVLRFTGHQMKMDNPVCLKFL